MTSSTLVTWLQERTALSVLPITILNAIAQIIEEQVVPANQELVVENTVLDNLYILQQGRLNLSTNQNGESLSVSSLLPGSVIGLKEVLLKLPAKETVITLTECQMWVVNGEVFRQLAAQYPEITQTITRQLIEEVAQLSDVLNYEQERIMALRPYLVNRVKRGIIGKSKYAIRLRQQIKQATSDRRPVLIFGEPGLEKDNAAALIHFSSPGRHQPMIKVDCGRLQASGAELFGRVGAKPGLLEWLGEGTLLLNNIQELPKELLDPIAQLLETGNYIPVSRSEENTEPRPSQARILIISEKNLPIIERRVGHLIKVPPLRVRKADISTQVDYYISLLSSFKGKRKPQITQEALRRLQSYDFPGNLRELETLVERAIAQRQDALNLTEEVFWSVETKKKRFRVNLLNGYPKLRKFLRSPWWPNRINGFTFVFFAFIVGVLILGPQHRQQNFALNLFWAWWWPLILLGFPFVGRLWCAVCPFMIYGEVTQKLSLWLFPRQMKRWPRESAEKWGGWFLYGFFILIYLWEELWDLEDTAYLSACLLLLITAGAMIFSAIFERRFWCRYLCPIGGMNGLFAKLSMTELRAQQGTCSAECTTYQCYKGGPQKGEGLETGGCPLYSHPAQLQDNRDCVLCMTCLKACPHRSVELNLRPPGIELWTSHVPRSYEVALLLLLLSGVFLHRLPELQSWLGLNFDLSQFLPHLGLSVAVLIIPSLIPLVAYGVILILPKSIKPKSFIELAYGYLPLVLGTNLAHYLRLGLTEAGKILPLSLATFGLHGEGLPVLVAHPAVIDFLQGTTLIASVFLTVVLTQKIARQPLRYLLPQHFGAMLLAASFWQVIVG